MGARKIVNSLQSLTWECSSRAPAFSFCKMLSSVSSFWHRSFNWMCELSRAFFSARRFIISFCACAASSLAAALSNSALRLRSPSSIFSPSIWKGNQIISNSIWSLPLTNVYASAQELTWRTMRLSSTLSSAKPSLRAAILAMESFRAASSFCNLVKEHSLAAIWDFACGVDYYYV